MPVLRKTGFRARMAIAVCAMTIVAPAAAGAKTYEVTRHGDPNPGQCKPNDCSLREAIRAANNHDGEDVVVLPDRRSPYNLRRANDPATVDEEASFRGDLDVSGKLTIRHPGRGTATIDANRIDRVLEVHAATLLKRLRVTGGGNVSQDPLKRRTSVAGSGGGIEGDARLVLRRSAVVGNTGADGGGGIALGPDDPGDAPSLLLVRSRVARNETIDGVGGGIFAGQAKVSVIRSKVLNNRPDNAGGGIMVVSGSDLRLSKSTVAGNRAGAGSGGVSLFQANGRISQSTISGNRTDDFGSVGGIQASQSSTLRVINSTVANNRADVDAGGIRSSVDATVILKSVTVARNVADSDGDNLGEGGGLLAQFGGTFSLVNSLIVLNRTGATPDDCAAGTVTSGGGNMLSVAPSCAGFNIGSGDFLSANPKIGELRNNGGPTKTIALRRGSPAIGKAVEAAAPERDQRGVKRDNNPDIGAFERR